MRIQGQGRLWYFVLSCDTLPELTPRIDQSVLCSVDITLLFRRGQALARASSISAASFPIIRVADGHQHGSTLPQSRQIPDPLARREAARKQNCNAGSPVWYVVEELWHSEYRNEAVPLHLLTMFDPVFDPVS